VADPRSKRHLKSTQEKIGSLERARQRMKSAPPGECYENEQVACCPFEEHMHHMCRASLTLPAAHHRYSYHGPCGCSSNHLAAEPPPPYDYLRWRYLLKVLRLIEVFNQFQYRASLLCSNFIVNY